MNRPLLIVTRARDQASGFSKILRAKKFQVVECPTIKIKDPKTFRWLDQAIVKIDQYDWLIFTSVNAVEKFYARAKMSGTKLPKHLKTCAIGPATAHGMKQCKMPVTHVARDYVAESILDRLKNVRGLKILIPRAEVARDVLPVELKKRGAAVDVVSAYRTVSDVSKKKRMLQLLAAGRAHCVTFTSSSTVRNFFALVGARGKKIILRSSQLAAASIGPITTATLKEHGWPPKIVAKKSTTKHLAEAIAKYYKNEFHGSPTRAFGDDT